MITPPEILFVAFILVVVVGVLSSIYPAKKAADMSPIDAIRF
jgi:putative ABC transport system permease protein